MKWLPEEGRDRTLAVGILLPVAALATFRVLFVEPQIELLGMRRIELEQRRAEAARARHAAGRLPQLDDEVQRLRGRYEQLKRSLAEEDDASSVLTALQELAVRSRLTVQSFALLDGPSAGEAYEELRVRLELKGGFHELASFLDAVSRLPRIVTIGQLSIRALPAGTPNATIAATCIATTYLLRESTDDVDARGAGGGLRP